MSHEVPSSNSHDSIDTDRPYLVPRKSGKIEVWHVETNKDGTPKVDEQGWIVISGQNKEMNAEGKLSVPATSAHPKALTDEVQGHYADMLGQARRGATPEQFERYAAIEEDLAETALEAMGLEEGSNDAPESEKPVEETEKEVDTDKFYRELAGEYALSSEIADRITHNLTRSDADEHFRGVRRHAAETLNALIRESLHASRLPSPHDYEQIADMFRQASRSFHETREYAFTGDTVAQLASQINASEERVDTAAHSYFRDSTPENAEELSGDIHRAKIAQLEVASILREEIQRQVDRIDREDASVDQGLSEINQRFMYLTEYNETSVGNVYAQVQDILRAISDSDSARHELDRLLQQLAIYNDDLKQAVEKFAQ